MVKLDIDSELLIKLVEERPVIWNRKLESYKCRLATKAAWKEIVDILFPGLCEKKRLRYGKLIIQKWTHIRDSFMRSMKKLDEQKRMGCTIKAKRYLYAKQLSFFQKTLGPLDIYDPLYDNDMESKDATDHDEDFNTTSQRKSEIDLQGIVRNMHVTNVTTLRKPITDTSIDELEAKSLNENKSINEKLSKFLNSMESLEKNRHMSFFQGILPSLNAFDDDEVLEFQMGVLQLIRNIKSRSNAEFKEDCTVSGSSMGRLMCVSLAPVDQHQDIKEEI